MTYIQPAAEIEALLARQGHPVRAAVAKLVRAVAKQDADAERVAVEELGHRLSELLGLADLLGARRVELLARQAVAGVQAAQAGLVPKVTFKAAVDGIVQRYPAVVPESVRILGADEVQLWIASLYEQAGFTLARTSKTVVVNRVQDVIAAALKGGRTREQAIQDILAAGAEHGDDWTRAYAETVYVNNASTAYHSGVHRQTQSEPVQKVMAGFVFHSVLQPQTTPECRAMHGTLAPFDHPIWDERTPLIHHRCKSGLRMISWAQARRMGAVAEDGRLKVHIPNPDVKPKPGFGRRRMA